VKGGRPFIALHFSRIISVTKKIFTKAMQLTHANDYRRVYAARSSAVKGPLRVSAAANDKGIARIGLSVPGKVGTNVKRNRIKRLIREAFRLNRGSFPAGLDIVVGVHPHDEKTLDEYASLMLAGVEAVVKTRERREKA